MSRASREVHFWNGWKGGLNLSSAPPMLEKDETPDCANVVFDERGGFKTRKGFIEVAAADKLVNGFLLLAHANNVIMVGNDGSLVLWDGNAFSYPNSAQLTDADLNVLRPVAKAFNNKVYFANCYDQTVLDQHVWDGASLTTLNSTSPYNDDYTAPAGGKFPKCRLVANHNGHMWAADIADAGVRYPSRIRFSHPGQPEDWATNDYFDVSPENERDSIRGLFSFRDELLVFKESGVFAVGGWDRFSFYQRRISANGGACVSTAVDGSAGVAYWVSNQGTVYAYNGDSVVPIGEKIDELWKTGIVECSSRSIACWSRGSLYCSLDVQDSSSLFYGVPLDGDPIQGGLGEGETPPTWQTELDYEGPRYPKIDAGMYVYTPSRRGASWTRHTFKPSSMLYWQRAGGNDQLLFTVEDRPGLFDFMNESQTVDVVADEAYPVRGYLKTSWADGGETATRKRWRRPRFTAAAVQPTNLRVLVYRDYRYETPIRTLSGFVGPEATGNQLVWEEGDWDDTFWVQQNDLYRFRRYGSAGSAHAIQFLIYSLDNPSSWWVDSIALPFRRRSIR